MAAEQATRKEVDSMIEIFIDHGEVIDVLEQTDEPEPKHLKEGVDFEVEYLDK